MLQVTFETDGKIRVYVYADSEHISVSTYANKLQAMLPAPIFQELRDRMGALLEITSQPALSGERQS